MRKNLTIIILVVAIILQLSVPIGMIIYSKNTEDALPEYGKEFKIQVYVQRVYEGAVDYNFYGYDLYEIGRYAVLEEDEAGFANLTTIEKLKPETPYYIRVTMDNKAKFVDYPTDSDVTAWRVCEDSAYLVVKAYKGEMEVVNLYIDDIPAEEWLETAIVEQDEYGKNILYPAK